MRLFVCSLVTAVVLAGAAAAQPVDDAYRPPPIPDAGGFRQYQDPAEAPSTHPSRTPSSIGDAIDPLLAPPSFYREAPPPPAVEIEWRVENPFRFFVDPKDTEVHRATYLSLSPEQRESAPVLASEHALARRHESGWAESMYRKTCWAGSRNRYVCPDKSDYVNPQSHRVVVTLKGVVEPDLDCRWVSAELREPGEQAGAESAITQPCGAPIVLTAPYPTGLAVRVEIGGMAVASTEVKVTDLFVIGIGDSFGSGEGNPDVPVRFSPERTVEYGKGGGGSGDLTGYPARAGSWKQIGDAKFLEGNARWLDQACHRSLYSYQLRVALGLAVEDPHRAVTYAGFACSGAEVTWGLFLRYKGNEWVPNPPDLSQISAAADAQCGKQDAPKVDMPEAYHMNGVIPELQGGLTLDKCPVEKARKIDLVLVSIGGNDIGFARLVANAVLADSSLVRSLGGWFGQVHGNRESQELLTRLDQRYKALNRALHGILHVPWQESDRIIMTAYPPFALLDDAGNMCRDGTAGMEVFSEFRITQKAALSSSWLADKLDRVMKQSAKAHGWTYADVHRSTFIGRGLCAGHSNGLGPLVDDLRLPRLRNGIWQPYNPVHYQPYAARLRWFRTPNDAFLTGNFHAAGSVMQNVLKLQSFSWFQVLLAATYGGAFHPSAEGHAAMADAALLRARAVLARHGQHSASTPEAVSAVP
ncbi:hypothetical protein [Hyphomicrobium sp. CS1GBMeth3]|uniref:hypothetical protein n=1 Tax=Hyphomicrobium sp. CS1GBMeth3 TaxID=1892845 RepID=UPI000A4D24FC|nr:hypothetical protein [Hyphomicrobium sp. CS1GBMeth3]